MRGTKGLVLSIILLSLVVSGTRLLMMKKTPSDSVKVFLISSPFSTDPIEYDAFVHHMTFRSTYSSVISEYSLGTYVGILADSWSNSSNFQKWEFNVRDNLTFQNGDRITPKTIVESWTRLAFLMKERASKSDFFDNLLEIEHLSSPTARISGLTYDDKKISIHLKNPVPNLLNIISFGIYAIVHPNDYDHVSGKWLDPHKINSSGPYKITSWNDQELIFNLRDDFKLPHGHPKRFKNITFFWDPTKQLNADLIMGDSIEVNLKNPFQFYGGANSSIAYARCRSWKIESSPCAKVGTRRILRDLFYKKMETGGTKIIRSFFPLAIKNIHELTSPNDAPMAENNTTAPTSIKFALSKTKNPVFQAYNSAVQAAISTLGKTPEEKLVPRDIWMNEYKQDLNTYAADLYMLSTGILIDDPLNDVRFMFLSKEGIRLPDEHGLIAKELNKPIPDIQYINQILWDEAIVWPVTHYASGLWAREGFDFSLVNLLSPPTDFQWIGWAQ